MVTPPSKSTLPVFAAPLYARMVQSAAPVRRPGIEKVYGEVINVVRRHGAHAVVKVALAELWKEHGNHLEMVKSMPWLHLLVVKWALQDKRVPLAFAPQDQSYTIRQHLALMQKLWDTSQQDRETYAAAGGLWRLMRRIMYVQFDFQRRPSWSFLRWPALIARLPKNHRARDLFVQAMGMQPERYADLAMAVFSFLQDQERFLETNVLAPLSPHYGADLDTFLRLFARNMGELRDELQAEAAKRTRGMAELNEFPYLQRFPLLRLQDGRFQLWHPVVFTRGLENAVHLRLNALGQDYPDTYSKVFESYVTELAMNACPQGITEAAYRAQCGQLGNAVEVAIPFGSCNVFIEAKLSHFHDDVILEDDPNLLRDKIKRVRKAIQQGLQVAHSVRQPDSTLHPGFAGAEKDFLMVITSRDLLLVSGEGTQKLMPDIPLFSSDTPGAERMPLNQIFVVDITDYERIMCAVAEGKVHLAELLQRAAIANQNAVDGRLELSQHIDWKGAERPDIPVVSAAATDARHRLIANLGGNPDELLET
ncbi:GapS1 family protein [Hydrogenophaga sp. BPS33]|uniref:GapS1 family protein n=1 Tax=Hydrogenophaga sp. BPS33 TaxID=2651974 RepID=UPI00131F6638|nr:hypothetical protein [Hydrogenophaga sp. BPS33]QHE84818.1 hypothetical protein F9K07_07945 [Hydrogenophaga sp. BPS33]